MPASLYMLAISSTPMIYANQLKQGIHSLYTYVFLILFDLQLVIMLFLLLLGLELPMIVLKNVSTVSVILLYLSSA